MQVQMTPRDASSTPPKQFTACRGNSLSKMNAIKAGTSRAAELLGVQASVGSIVAGKQADCILVNGDPLADMAALGKVALVMKAGQVVFRS